MRANGGFANWNMIEIHKQICVDKRDSERVEQEFCEKYNADMNAYRPFITDELMNNRFQIYRDNNEVKVKVGKKLYYENNFEKIALKAGHKFNCFVVVVIENSSKSAHFKRPIHLEYEASLLK